MFKSFAVSRNVVVILSFFGLFIAYIIRTNLSVAIVAMVHNTPSRHICDNNQTINNQSLLDQRYKQIKFDWDIHTQGYILASFFYGYIVTQIPGGCLSFKYGSKSVLGFGILLASVFTLISPFVARWSAYGFMFCRFVQGLGQGVILPATHNLISKWATPMQKTKLTTLIYSGIPLGTIVSMPLSGYLARYGFDGGWPSIFYVTGLLGCLWFVLWVIFVYETPLHNPTLAEDQKLYVREKFPHQSELMDTKSKMSWRSVPLISMLSSFPFWAIVVSNVSHTWGLYTLITEIPTYYKKGLGLTNIYSNGLLSSLPFIAMWVCMLSGGQITDFLRSRKRVQTIRIRKIMNSLGLFVPSVLLIIISIVMKNKQSTQNMNIPVNNNNTLILNCNINGTNAIPSIANAPQNRIQLVIAIFLITCIAGFLGFGNSGYMVNPLDLSPPLAGIIMSISNTFGTLSGIISPSITSAFLLKYQSQGWTYVFLFASAVLAIGAFLYCFWASAQEQIWSPNYILSAENNISDDSSIKALPFHENEPRMDGENEILRNLRIISPQQPEGENEKGGQTPLCYTDSLSKVKILPETGKHTFIN